MTVPVYDHQVDVTLTVTQADVLPVVTDTFNFQITWLDCSIRFAGQTNPTSGAVPMNAISSFSEEFQHNSLTPLACNSIRTQ